MDVVVCDCVAGTDKDGRGVVGRLAGTRVGVGFIFVDGTDKDTLDKRLGKLLHLDEEQSSIL